MREILFRSKRIVNGEWVYGGFHSRFGRAFIIGISKTLRIDGIEVDPETVGEYTGLTDRNGNKIFEGDIVKLSSGNFGLIKYDGGMFRCVGKTEVKPCVGNINDHVEVVGNIHDNPELLGGDKNGFGL